jgi:adenylate cyclase
MIYGDGVNVAARPQARATPGGVIVSGPVFDAVREDLAGPFGALDMC